MIIQVRFFASLREQLNIDSCELEIPDPLSAKQVWERVTNNAELPGNVLCAVNMEYVTLQHMVKPGDEVAFFPPVTGG